MRLLLLTALAATSAFVVRRQPGAGEPRSADWLSILPEGETKRQFILDCTGCHQFDGQVARPNGQPRSRGEWEAAVTRMLGFAGSTTGFPVIAHAREAASTAAWLSQHATASPPAPPTMSLPRGASVTEYDLPESRDLAHDVAIDSLGQVIVTGMMSHQMYVLDTTTRAFATVGIPTMRANPRAVEVDGRNDWWVVLGAPNAVARYQSFTGRWQVFDVKMYAHSVALDAAGNAWVNGHFTSDPVKVTRIASDGSLTTFDLPKHPELSSTPGGPIPYEIRVAPDGKVWVSELTGNRIVSLDPVTRQTQTWDMPQSHSGPRRFDIDASGALWIPAYATNELLKFEPATGVFTRHVLPVGDALPYVAKVDARRGVVWVGSGSADAVFAFDPRTNRFATYPLPSRGAMVRHMAIHPQTGDVWLTYGASPSRIGSKVARLKVG